VIGTYRKKPVEIQAVRYDGTNWEEIERFVNGAGLLRRTKVSGPGRGMSDAIEIRTLEGTVAASVGDWVIRGAAGEFYPCEDSAFHATYEEVRPNEL
jgi:hypothetical protein